MDADQSLQKRTLYLYRFGTAEFDESQYELRVGSVPIDVQRKPLELLAVLLCHSGEVVTKEELLDTVWPGMTTVENVIANAMTKLRNALGDSNAAMVLTQPRIGYRFNGQLERIAVGRKLATRLELKPGTKVPGREHFILAKLIGQSRGSEVWTARHAKNQEMRVYKFSPDGAHLAGLKREATLSRVLRSTLGPRDDMARILDWNFETPPFFLECQFGGQNLVEWAEEDGRLPEMTMPERLGIFLQIADAVSAAHSVGVLHKDLKPSNVLVAAKPGGWQVRLTDFGSGRLLDPDELERLGITPIGAPLSQTASDDASSGTPLYLAPELIAGETATLRSDVYALGLMLYQIIVGNLRRPLISTWDRDIEDPLLRADVAAATDGDPSLRLGSAAELARRLRSLDERRREALAVQTAEAASRATAEALKRNEARRPWVIATLGGLAIGVVVSSSLYLQVRKSAANLAVQVHTAKTLTSFLTDDLITAADPMVSGRADVTMADALRHAASKIDTKFAGASPQVRALLHIEMQRAFRGLTENDLAVAQGDQAVAALQTPSNPDPSAADVASTIDAQLNTADSLIDLERLKEARARLDSVGSLLKIPALAEASDTKQLQARFLMLQGFLAIEAMDVPAYLHFMGAAWSIGKTIPDLQAQLGDHMAFALADAYRMSGQSAQAESMFHDLILRENREYGEDDARPAYVAAALAEVLSNENRNDEALHLLINAVPILEHALGPRAHKTISAKHALADIYYSQKKFDDAASLLTEVATAYAAVGEQGGSTYLSAMVTLGQARLRGGHPVAAEKVMRDAIAAGQAHFRPEMPLMQSLRFYLAESLLDQQRVDEVPKLLLGLTPAALNMAELEPDWAARLDFVAGRLALMQGDKGKARVFLQKALAGSAGAPNDGFLETPKIQAFIQLASTGIHKP